MRERSETSAGGVVFRRSHGRTHRPAGSDTGAAPDAAVEVAIGEQIDRLTREPTVRLPKGRVDAGETLEQAAMREVAEEFGLRTRVVAPLGTSRHGYCEGDVRVRKHVHYFLLECLPGDPMPIDGEMQRVLWCSLEQAEQQLTFDSERRAIGWARDRLRARAPA